MIGKLSGLLDYRAADHVLIDVRGVGYVVYCSERTLASLPPPGCPVALFTELVVREDLLQLFGFPTLAEREWHRLLTTVQGVGAKAALAILGALGAEGVARAIAVGDAASIRRAPGVGPKIAERIVLELKNRVPAVMAMGAAGARPAEPSDVVIEPPTARSAPVAAPPVRRADGSAQSSADALSALVNLGYGQGEAAGAVAEAAGEAPDADAPALIRSALRRLAPKG